MQEMNQNRLRTVGGKKRGKGVKREGRRRVKKEEIKVKKGRGGRGNDLGSKQTAESVIDPRQRMRVNEGERGGKKNRNEGGKVDGVQWKKAH